MAEHRVHEILQQPENHGRVVQLTYHRNRDGTIAVLQSPAPFKFIATCPSERKALQEQYSAPAYNAFNAWLESGSSEDLEVLSRDAHTGWVEVTDCGIVHVIKDLPHVPNGFALDVIGGATKSGEQMKHAALRELAEETVHVDLKKGKLLTPDVNVRLLTNLIYEHYLHASSLELNLPKDIADIIEAAKANPYVYTEQVPTSLPQFKGSENLITCNFRSELKGKPDEINGILTVHPDGLNILQPMHISGPLDDLRIVDLECLEQNRDEKPRALRRNFATLTTDNMRAYLEGKQIEVPILGTHRQYLDRISPKSHGIKNLGLAFAQTVTRYH